MKWRMVLAAALLAAVLAGAFWPIRPARPRKEITVLAAASLADVLPRIGDAFEQAHGTRVRFDFASSGILRAKIEAGAPADLFLSASDTQMDQLRSAGRVRDEDRRDLLTNQLVCVAPRRATLPLNSPADLAAPAVRRIAIGDPAHVPAGEYAREALQRLGLWEQLQPRLVPSADVRAALAQAQSGAVEAAIVYRTDAAVSPDVRIAFEFPAGSHAPIVYPAAVLAGAPHPTGARAFLDWLFSDSAAEVFTAYGFTPLRGPSGVAASSGRNPEQPVWTASTTEALRLSLRVSLTATLLMVIVGSPIAFRLARRKGPLSAAVEALLFLPLVLPPVVTGYLLLLLFSPQAPLGRWLDRMGIRVVLDWKGAVIAAVTLAFPLFLAVAKAALSKADPLMESAARTLNAAPARVLWTITLPPALPGLAAAAALAFARAFGEFGATMMLAGNIPGQTRTVPQAVFTHLMVGEARAAWGLVAVSVLIGLGAMIAAHGLLATWRGPDKEQPAHA